MSALLKVDQVALKLEEDVSSLKEKWSELNAQLEESQGTIAELTGRELVLTSQLDQSSARVVVLESLLQVQSTSLMGQEELLAKNKSALNILREEIEDTKNNYEASCQEVQCMGLEDVSAVCVYMYLKIQILLYLICNVLCSR